MIFLCMICYDTSIFTCGARKIFPVIKMSKAYPRVILFGSAVYTTTVLPIPVPWFQLEESLEGGWKVSCLAPQVISQLALIWM